MSKHTPGPWQAKRCLVERKVRVYGPAETRYENSEPVDWHPCVARIDDMDIKIKEGEANARLISAAPELLEELKIAVMNCPCSIPERDSGHQSFCRAPIWNELIAKAESTDAD